MLSEGYRLAILACAIPAPSGYEIGIRKGCFFALCGSATIAYRRFTQEKRSAMMIRSQAIVSYKKS
jgi:hypothetical protein